MIIKLADRKPAAILSQPNSLIFLEKRVLIFPRSSLAAVFSVWDDDSNNNTKDHFPSPCTCPIVCVFLDRVHYVIPFIQLCKNEHTVVTLAKSN